MILDRYSQRKVARACAMHSVMARALPNAKRRARAFCMPLKRNELYGNIEVDGVRLEGTSDDMTKTRFRHPDYI